MTFRCPGEEGFAVLLSSFMLSHIVFITTEQQKFKRKITLKNILSVKLIQIDRCTNWVQLLAKYRKFRHNRENRCWGPVESDEAKSLGCCWMPNKAVRHVEPRRKTTYCFTIFWSLSPLPSTQHFSALTKSVADFIIRKQTGKKRYALLISPHLLKVFIIDYRAVALLKYVQMFSTNPLIIEIVWFNLYLGILQHRQHLSLTLVKNKRNWILSLSAVTFLVYTLFQGWLRCDWGREKKAQLMVDNVSEEREEWNKREMSAGSATITRRRIGHALQHQMHSAHASPGAHLIFNPDWGEGGSE